MKVFWINLPTAKLCLWNIQGFKQKRKKNEKEQKWLIKVFVSTNS